jgi:cytochrome c556
MYKLLPIFLFLMSPLFASEVINQRQDSMQDFNKLMRAANQTLKNGEIEGLAEIYGDIESIMKIYPTLFPDDSFDGKTKASNVIIDNREAFNQIANDTSEWAALAKIAAENNDLETLQQHHQSLYGSCKNCHSRFKN